MTVAFYHAAAKPTVHLKMAAMLIASVRRVMPDVPIVHLTDATTEPVDGVDLVQRVSGCPPVALGCLQAYAAAGTGDWLFVDTDVIVQEDVRHVFDKAFDVAVATREGTLKPSEVGRKFFNRSPYNKGAVWSRSADFWADAVKACETMQASRQAWMGDQIAMNEVIAAGQYRVTVLANRFNYPPKYRSEDLRTQAVLHYKGPRKEWLLERAA